MGNIPYDQWIKLFELIPMVSTDAVVIKNNQILLVKRIQDPFKDHWCLPGGFIDKGETSEKAASREVFEETGIKSEVIKLIGVYSDPKRDLRGHTITIVYQMKPVGGKIATSNETSEVKYFPLDKIPKNLAFDHDKIIKDALSILRKTTKR